MNIQSVCKFLYLLTGVIFLIAGSAALLFLTGLLPESAKNIILNVARNDLNALHLTQEFSSLLAGVGVMALWFSRNYKQSGIFHIAMIVFFGFLALIHWFDVRGNRSIIGPAINSVPFLIYFVIGIIRIISK
jgi:hypothetical protein